MTPATGSIGRRRTLVGLCVVVLFGSLLASSPQLARAQQDGPSTWRTWLLSSPDQFRPPAPPGDGHSSTRRDLRELRKKQSDRNRAIKRRVRFWNSQPATVRWTELALRMIRKNSPRPPFAARALALLHAGMYDALVAAADARQAYRRTPPSKLDERIEPLLPPGRTSYPPTMAVVAGAAEELLEYLYPNEIPGTFEEIASKAIETRVWAGVNYRTDVRRARSLGRRVAELFIARGEADGHKDTTPLTRPEGEQYWEETPPRFEPPIGGPVSRWDPWLMEEPSQARSGSGIAPPYEYGSDAFMAELREVMEVQENLTEEEKEIATFWDDGPRTYTPAGHWNDIALDLVRDYGVDEPEAAKMFALLNAAMADGAIAFFEAKYAWWSIRPVTVVRRLCDDGARLCTREELEQDPDRATYPDWLPFIVTPPFPSYPGGHSTFSGSAGAVLTAFFPPAEETINELAEEAANSRLLGGIHFRSDNDAGLILGRYIAELALDWPSGS